MDGHRVVAQTAADGGSDLGGIAGVLAAVLVDGEGITGADYLTDGQSGILQHRKEFLDDALLIIGLTGVQVRKNDCCVDGLVAGCVCVYGHHAEHHHKSQNKGQDAFNGIREFHVIAPFLYFWGRCCFLDQMLKFVDRGIFTSKL